ncbi:unnamed protein product [Lactuca saligna]|uniref:Xrn1 helical domain-containing protein n=1 Tax=Lactuca saligna TaxID=75948 RepID=A0AA36E3Q7_LACSI|nr:unnamed protein product [Lactuca saligna]
MLTASASSSSLPQNSRSFALSKKVSSAHALPPSYRSLMTTDDSRILDFYVDDFDVDTDGKRFIWQGICKFPFIDEERLLDSTKMIKKELTERSHLSNGSMDDHNRGSGQMMDGTQINIDVTALGAIIALGLMYLKVTLWQEG